MEKKKVDANQSGPIDPTGDKAGFVIWNVVPNRKGWKKDHKIGTHTTEGKRKRTHPEATPKRQERYIEHDTSMSKKDKMRAGNEAGSAT
ncbi:hypothetical protein ACE6H2_002767 [Prunus campanulata]